MAFLDDNGLTTVWERMKTYVSNIVSNYVKKEDGKGLSSNDYTTTEKNKLSNIEEGAQKNQNAFSAFTFIRSEENGGNIKFSANSPSTELPWTLSPIFSIGSSYGGPMLSLKEATESEAGVMSKSDKTKLEITNIGYGTCSTPAATAAKVISISGNANWKLKQGSIILIKFSHTNTASNPTFNVNETGAKPVWYDTSLITTENKEYAGKVNRPMIFLYDGTQYVFIGWSYEKDTTYSVFVGASNSTYGTRGLVPAPNAGSEKKFLKANGTWATPAIDEGGTGAVTAKGAEYNILGGMPESTDALSDNSIVVFRRTSPSDTDGVTVCKKVSLFWDYIKNKSDNEYAKKSDISNAYKYKGSVTSANNLPTSGVKDGDVYNIEAASTYGPAGTNVAWTGSEWDSLGGMLSITAMTTTEINNICTLT